MRGFYETPFEDQDRNGSLSTIYMCAGARVAIYDGPLAAPRVVDIAAAPVGEFIEAIASRVYELAKAAGGSIPYSVIREVSENLIHARFAEPVVSILENGSVIRFADSGPGVRDKVKALLPGFTSATSSMKQYIRGVGSGLPIVNEYLSHSGGRLEIDDNLGAGTVVTLSHRRAEAPVFNPPRPQHTEASFISSGGHTVSTLPLEVDPPLVSEAVTDEARLTTRQKQVLALVMESGSAGPSLVSRELGIALSTAYRDLACLEELGYIEANGGKRQLTRAGMAHLDSLISATGLDDHS